MMTAVSTPEREVETLRSVHLDGPVMFGKYLLVDRIAIGGMAEVFKATSSGIEGFERNVAIKRILPSVSEDPEFIRMFIDEAKIAGALNHANVCPIYELGRVGEIYYIAMEFVWGKDVLQIINRLRRLRKRMPPAMAAWIGSRVCEALDYAHTRKDPRGNPLGIVHRDVSPQNILVSYDGEVKLIDFGIAKAVSRLTKTHTGVLKGKFGYMTPEHVNHGVVDARSDIFTLGTCLHEMVVGNRLFRADSDFATLERVRNVEFRPPSEIVPGFSQELNAIICKALSADPNDRFQTAAKLGDALNEFLSNQMPLFSTPQLSTWMKTAFEADIEKEKQGPTISQPPFTSVTPMSISTSGVKEKLLPTEDESIHAEQTVIFSTDKIIDTPVTISQDANWVSKKRITWALALLVAISAASALAGYITAN